jgi:hypothetical protein
VRDEKKLGKRICNRWTKSVVLLALAAVSTFLLPTLRAQQLEELKGIDQGNYNIKQSIEFGGRFTSISGDQQAYDTFVNLQQGARLLGFTMEMNSLDHHGTWFDRFYFSNFGYGGDPNEVSLLRMSKNNWYNFNALFRKDQNAWDYLLLANPLNPSTPPIANARAGFNPIVSAPVNVLNSAVIGTSPHPYSTRRKLGDYTLLLLPQSKVRFRVGYSNNNVNGPGFSSIHQGTEQYLLANYSTIVNTYRIGVDFRLLPRTNISYDQIWMYYKGDSTRTDNNQQFALSNGQLVDLGVSFNQTPASPPLQSAANQPCANPFGGPPAGAVNQTCNAYFSYLNGYPTRTSAPTEQLSMQSNYWKNWDISARFSYSGGDTNIFDYNQVLFGREARTNLRNDATTGAVQGRRVAATADGGVTWHINDKLSLLDTYHYSNWHDPAQFISNDCSYFSPNLLTNALAFATSTTLPATCGRPAGVNLGTPVHSTSSLTDIGVNTSSNFLKQEIQTNLSELEYQFTPKYGARLGFRYLHRAIADNFFSDLVGIYFPNNAARGNCAKVDPTLPLSQANLPQGCTLNNETLIATNNSISFATPSPAPSGVGLTLIDQYAGVFGFWAKPVTNWRISFDTELMSANNAFTRISPTHAQTYRVRSKYKVNNWLNLSGSISIYEALNNQFLVNDKQHNRAYGISATLQPTEKWGLELGYDYNDVYSQIPICYISIASGQAGPGQACPNVVGLVQQLSTYVNQSNYGYFDATYTPFNRLTVRMGANLTGTSGSELRLDPQALIPNSVTGPLNSLWLHPFGSVEYSFAKGWAGKALWDYYGYHEDPTFGAGGEAVIDVFAPRNFRGNLVTLSLRYAF